MEKSDPSFFALITVWTHGDRGGEGEVLSYAVCIALNFVYVYI